MWEYSIEINLKCIKNIFMNSIFWLRMLVGIVSINRVKCLSISFEKD